MPGLDPVVEGRLESLRQLIGRTPMMVIRCRYRGRDVTVCAKYEVLNFTGSIKDRMALRVMEVAYDRRDVASGDMIAEATSGNTGISIAAVGRALGHPVRIYMPDWMSRERVQLIKSLGAEIVPISAQEGGFRGAVQRVEALVESEPHVFAPRQFESSANPEAHARSTGPELHRQLDAAGIGPVAFVAGVGTGGTVMGVGRYLREHLPRVRVHPLEPANSPTLRTGHRVGSHRIQGISDEFIPAIVHLEELDEIVDVWDGDAILMAQRLAAELGLGVGISSGANFLGAVRLGHDAGSGAAAATVFPDSNKKYLSTDLCRVEPVRDDYMTPQIEILGCRVVPGR